MYERFIARQPIFDHGLKVFAYELLFRGGPQNVFKPWKDASSSVIVESTMFFDLQTLTGSAKAFINADQNALLQGAVRLLPPDRIVVEILETVVPTPEVVAACADLRESGYVLGLDDFDDHPKWEPLLPLARFLKVDFRAPDGDLRRDIAKRYLPQGLQLLAEKVETQAELDEARSMGYTCFQGYFFCKPTMVEGRGIPGNKLNYVRLIAAVNASEFDFAKIEEILKQEPSLGFFRSPTPSSICPWQPFFPIFRFPPKSTPLSLAGQIVFATSTTRSSLMSAPIGRRSPPGGEDRLRG